MGCKMDAVSRHENIKFHCPSPPQSSQLCCQFCYCAKSLHVVLTLRDPIDYQAPLSDVILQARILESVATPSFRGSSQPRDQTSTALAGGFFTTSTTWEALSINNTILKGIFSEPSGLNSRLKSFSKHCKQIRCHPGYVVPSIYRVLAEQILAYLRT